MPFSMRVLPCAHQDIEDILHFIANVRSAPGGATRWFKAYQAALDRLADRPRSCQLAPENTFVEFDVRQLMFGS